MNHHRRRIVMGGLAIAASNAFSQGSSTDAERVKRVGVLRVVDEHASEGLRRWKEGFHQSLASHGFRPGVHVDVQWFEFPADADWNEAVPKLAGEMVAARLDCMVASGDILTRRLAQATRTVPIVAELNDPVALGFATSLSHPGGNVTGVHRGLAEVSTKRVQFFKALVPAARAVAWIGFRPSLTFYPTFEDAARQGGFTVRQVLFDHADDAAATLLGQEFPRFRREGCLAAHIFTSSPALVEAAGILALKHRIALSHPGNVETDGVLFSYRAGGDLSSGLSRLTHAVGRVLRGEKPGDIPISGPTRYALELNRRTAARIGVSFPKEMLLLADRVVG